MHLRLESAFAGNVHIIRCSGAIVLGEDSGALEAAFKERSLAYTHFVLTLIGVNRLDSIGLGLIVRYMTSVRQRGGDLRIAAPSGFVATLLNKTMLSTVLRVFPTEAEAVASYSRQAVLPSGRVTRRPTRSGSRSFAGSMRLCPHHPYPAPLRGPYLQHAAGRKDRPTLQPRGDCSNWPRLGPSLPRHHGSESWFYRSAGKHPSASPRVQDTERPGGNQHPS